MLAAAQYLARTASSEDSVIVISFEVTVVVIVIVVVVIVVVIVVVVIFNLISKCSDLILMGPIRVLRLQQIFQK